MSKDGSGNYHQRLHALDLALGTELFGGPVDIQATYPGTGDNSDGTNVIFDPGQYKERAALLLLNGVIYTGWASHCDIRPYTGWIMGYSESTLAQTSVLNVTPNGNEGAIWMSGAGLAADSSGNIYFLDANGDFDTTLNASGFPSDGDYGNAFMKLSTSGGLAVADYFEMDNEASENGSDTDLGSGGAMVLPDLSDGAGHTMHLAVGAGKDTNLYVVNRDSMGKFSCQQQQHLSGTRGAIAGRRLGDARIFQQHGVLRIGGKPDSGVHHHQREAVDQRHGANRQQLWISGRDAQRLGQWHQQRNRVGGGEQQPGSAACLRCQHSERTLQQQPGQRQPRSFRRRQQVHHADDRERQSLRGNAERRGGVRLATVSGDSFYSLSS